MKKIITWFAAGIVTTMLVATSYAAVTQAMTAEDLLPGAGDPSVSSCAYENMGWVICPVLNATATAADYAFSFMAQSFTNLEIGLFDNESGAAQAGGLIRNIANVLFVIAFLFIVYSLITGQGIGNYNLKRLVPRFILAVIFVNLSYFICQMMIDLSNILGVGIQQILVDTVAKNIGDSAMPLTAKIGEAGSPLSSIASGVTANGDIAWPLLAPLAAIVMSSAIVCSVLIVVLIIRKVLVVALALIAPLAFAAYLLPNTSDYFSKWLKLFIHTLLLFPIMSVLMGTGQIVSASILKAASSDYKVENDSITVNKKANQSATLYLVAAGAAVLPLVGTWYAFKAATSAIDAAGARVSRDGFRRSTREQDEKAKKREQTTIDMNKKSMMLRGINRLQQLNVAKDGESNASIFGKVGGAYRGRGKHQAKTPEQARFDNQVQQRLSELRDSGSGHTPQELYSQALQRYQDRIGDASDGGLNINSYEGIDLKASEAYLLESLGKGSGTSGAVGAVAAANGQGDGKSSGGGTAGQPESEKEKKSAGISSLNRDGKSAGGGGGGGNGQQPQDPYRPASTNAGVSPSVTGGAAAPQGGTVIIQQVQAPAAGSEAAQIGAGSRAGYAPRREVQDSNELLAKARAAKYVADTQDVLGQSDDDILGTATVSQNDTSDEPKV